jgi:hypothetical protein
MCCSCTAMRDKRVRASAHPESLDVCGPQWEEEEVEENREEDGGTAVKPPRVQLDPHYVRENLHSMSANPEGCKRGVN